MFSRWCNTFLWLVIFCVFMCLAQFVIALLDVLNQWGVSKVLPSLLDDFEVIALAKYVIWPLIVILGLHVLFALFGLLVSWVIIVSLRLRQSRSVALLIMTFLWLAVFLEAERVFPGSQFAFGVKYPEGLRALSVFWCFLAGVVVLALFLLWRLLGAYRLVLPVVLVVFGGGFLGARLIPMGDPMKVASTERPHIFIIGIDSLRRDLVGAMGAPESLTPNIDHILAGGFSFQNAYTPVARTYPAWMGILSGRYPINSGARVNLMSPALVDREQLLPKILRENGYKTIMAIDERRFSNIDETYGFDDVVGPDLGVQDFLAGSTVASSLVRVLVTLPGASYFLPYHYANRAVDSTYRPMDFLRTVSSALATSVDRPLFMTVHFCLPHWPYSWGEVRSVSGEPGGQYLNAVRHADAQLGQLMDSLRDGGFLENAWVVLLSDHGEALGRVEDMPFDTSMRVFGHGTDVLSSAQNGVVLGFRAYGRAAAMMPVAGYSRELTSLLDVAPTIYDLVGLPSSKELDGISLVGQLQGRQLEGGRSLFFETEFDLPGINQARPDVVRALEQGAGFYRLTTDGRVELRGDSLKVIVESKQRAIMRDNSMLGYYPGNRIRPLIFVQERLAQLKTFEECRRGAVCGSLLDELLLFYGEEIGGD